MAVIDTKAPNYTEAQEVEMREKYTAASNRETVDLLADAYGKSPRSIIAKLSNMGIYIAPARTTKAGKPIVKKETLVAEICSILLVDAPSLAKANKQDLEKVVEVVRELGSFEGVLVP
jgi:hypothetical protein